jgi:hypothetical protein
MRAVHRRKRFFRLRRLHKVLLVCGCVLCLLIILFIWVDRALQPTIRHVALMQLKQKATEAINGAIIKQVAQTQRFNDLMEWKMDATGKVYGAMFNQQAHAEMTAACIEVTEKTLTHLQNTPEHIPLGMILDSSLLAHWGPKIRINIQPTGAVEAQMGTNWKEAGINTMMLEIYVSVTADVRALIGFDAVGTSISTKIPLTYAVFNGDVPQYYMNQRAPGNLMVPEIK